MSGGVRVALVLVASSVVSLGLLAMRMLVWHVPGYGFLAWNLFLAWIPLLLAIAVVWVWRFGTRVWLGPLLVLWLVFFPNAPYVVTDFVHLSDIGGAPRWFDVLMLGSFAVTSLALGFVSLYLVQDVIRARFGVAWSWVSALTVIALSGVGIYLGRVDKLNSWDVLDPARLGSALGAAAGQSHRVLLALFLTFLLAASYVVGQRFAARHLLTRLDLVAEPEIAPGERPRRR